MLKRIVSIALLITLAGAVAFAHGGASHLKGKVTAVGENSITIETTDKQSKTVVFDQTTKFEKSGVAATPKDLMVGDRVVIDTHAMDGKLYATQVRFGASKKTAADSSPHAHSDKH